VQESVSANEIPDKTYFRIGEVARITGVKPYVLRFWESEFKMMSPPKSRSKQRMYRRRDIETILTIKKLLYEQGFTIKGARKRLIALQRGDAAISAPLEQPVRDAAPSAPADAQLASLAEIRDELAAIHRLLGGAEAGPASA
jgi:DNA-binding transcriptional MerR regulator